ncbi:MAG: LPS export ABC transporter ATP-binding protein [Planctomycetota bacterium]|nr:LPS export ABC transporter ATP-binding protein [Planctomycetota bacterium]
MSEGGKTASGVRIAIPSASLDVPLLSAEHLVKSFGKRVVVNDVSIVVRAGEIVGLLGRNGAGKTTAFRMIMGLLRPNSGRVLLYGRDVSRLPMFKRARLGLGYLAQEPSVFQRMTVEDNLRAVLEMQPGFDDAFRERRLEELLSELGLQPRRAGMAFTLSGGERRRLEIARALVTNPKLMLCDEPFVGIDPITVSELKNHLRRLRDGGMGILLTDHNVRDTLSITDRAYIMDEGRIWIHGTPEEIVRNAEARRIYLGADFAL